MKAEIIQVLASFVGSFGFAVLYRYLRGRNFVWLGFQGWYPGWHIYCMECDAKYICGEPESGGVATVYAETMARILKTPVTVFLITGIIPLFRRKFILHNELCSCQAMAFIFFIWTKDNLDRNRSCGRDHDSIIDLWDLCIRVEVL